MNERIIKIYQELYEGVKKKSYLAEKLGVTIKTIDNTIRKYKEDIVLDRNLGGYRFNSILPKEIPTTTFFQFFRDSIDNPIIKNDLIELSHFISTKEHLNLPMIPTRKLSNFAQKIISLNIMINTNCALQIDYMGGRGELETKYIKPHQIFVDNTKYYLYGSYIKENIKSIGEYRTFAINGISSIKPHKYARSGNFKTNHILNAYGVITKENYATLILKSVAANFFKREGYFAKDCFDFIMEDFDGSIIVKMYYNDINEILNITQQWMPFVDIKEDSLFKEVYSKIENNFNNLTSKSTNTDVVPRY